MIPKIIHYCWFGGNPLPPMAKKCIASWKKYCPDYEIVLWNEANYDFAKHPFMKQAYEQKKWAFVTDYARLDIVYNNGGLYFDTDVELLRSPDELLSHSLFMGFEDKHYVATGLGFGSVAGHPLLKQLCDDYNKITFSSEKMIPCPVIQTETLRSIGLHDDTGEVQLLDNGVAIYPSRFFAPRNAVNLPEALPDSYSIHHYEASWCDDQWKRRILIFVKKIIKFCLGKKAAFFIDLKRRLFDRKIDS